jgi:hypothetical protein
MVKDDLGEQALAKTISVETRSVSDRVLLPAVLETSLALVREWLVRVAGGSNLGLDVRNLRAVLINLLESIQEDAAISMAIDEVYSAALAYQEELNRAARLNTDQAYMRALKRARAMDAALADLRGTLVRAKPNSQGKQRGLLW